MNQNIKIQVLEKLTHFLYMFLNGKHTFAISMSFIKVMCGGMTIMQMEHFSCVKKAAPPEEKAE